MVEKLSIKVRVVKSENRLASLVPLGCHLVNHTSLVAFPKEEAADQIEECNGEKKLYLLFFKRRPYLLDVLTHFFPIIWL